MKDDSTDSLPRGWARVPLSEVTIEKVDQAGPKSGVQAFDYIDISSVDNETKVIGAPKRIALQDAPSRAKQNLRAGDILVSMTRPNLNAVGIVPAKLAGAIGSTGFDVLRATDAVDPGWLFMVVRSAAFVDAMTERVQGALYPAVRPRDIRAFETPLPPLLEQRRIVAKVEAVLAQVNAARERLAKVPVLLKRFRQSALSAACSGRLTADWRENKDLDAGSELLALVKKRGTPLPNHKDHFESLPKGWVATEFSYLMSELRNGIGTKPNMDPPGLPILRINAVRPGKVLYDDVRYMPNAENLVGTLSLKNRDLLFTRYNGSIELLGVCGMVRSSPFPALLYPDKLMRVRFDHDHALPEYVEVFFQSPEARDRLMDRAKSSAGQQGISGKDIKEQIVALPPLAEQREIVRRVEALFALADKIEARVTASIARADRLIQATLAKAFRGELVPTEAELAELEGREFETAQALLDRIHDERNRVAPSRGRNGSRRSASVARKAELRIK